MRGCFVCLSIVVLLATAILHSHGAQAQWIGQKIDDPFGTQDIVGAATLKFGKGLIVRCVGGTRRELMFLPNEQGQSSVAETANALGVTLLVRVDHEPVVSLAGVMHSSDGKLVVVADVAESLARQIGDARRRVAVALEAMGQKFDTVSFGVSGSGRQIAKVIRACGAARSASSAGQVAQRAAAPAGANVRVLTTEPAVLKVERTDRIGSAKISYVVWLKHRIGEVDLERMAKAIRTHEPGFKLTFIEYLLPGMVYGAGAWATSHFTPNLDVQILGLTRGQAAKIADARRARGPGVVGTWRINYLILSGVLVIRKAADGGYVSQWTFAKGGPAAKDVLIRTTTNGQTRFIEKDNGHGEYWVLRPDGDLEAWDPSGRLFTAQAVR